MDPPPYDVRLVYGLTSAWESDPRVALMKEELSKRGFRVGDSRSRGEARVTIVILAVEWFRGRGHAMSADGVQYAKYLCDTMRTLMKRGERVIPVLYGMTPSCLMPIWSSDGHSFVVWREFLYMHVIGGTSGGPRFPNLHPSPVGSAMPRLFDLDTDMAPMFADLSSIFASITALDLGRYNGDVDKVKLEAVLAVSDIVRTDLLEETKEYRSREQIFNKRVSASDEMGHRSAMFAINGLKLVAGELVKHAVDNVCPTPPHPHIGQPSKRFTNRVHHKKVRKVAARLSMNPHQFARKADLCIDGRNEVAHFLADKDWRKHCAEAVHFINRYPDVKKVVPKQCDIIMAYEEICDVFGL